MSVAASESTSSSTVSANLKSLQLWLKFDCAHARVLQPKQFQDLIAYVWGEAPSGQLLKEIYSEFGLSEQGLMTWEMWERKLPSHCTQADFYHLIWRINSRLATKRGPRISDIRRVVNQQYKGIQQPTLPKLHLYQTWQKYDKKRNRELNEDSIKLMVMDILGKVPLQPYFDALFEEWGIIDRIAWEKFQAKFPPNTSDAILYRYFSARLQQHPPPKRSSYAQAAAQIGGCNLSDVSEEENAVASEPQQKMLPKTMELSAIELRIQEERMRQSLLVEGSESDGEPNAREDSIFRGDSAMSARTSNSSTTVVPKIKLPNKLLSGLNIRINSDRHLDDAVSKIRPELIKQASEHHIQTEDTSYLKQRMSDVSFASSFDANYMEGSPSQENDANGGRRSQPRERSRPGSKRNSLKKVGWGGEETYLHRPSYSERPSDHNAHNWQLEFELAAVSETLRSLGNQLEALKTMVEDGSVEQNEQTQMLQTVVIGMDRCKEKVDSLQSDKETPREMDVLRSALISLQNDDSFPEEEREAIRWLTETWLSVKRDSDSRDPSPDSSVGLATPRPSRFLDQMSAFPSWTDLHGESTSHPMRIDEDDEDDCATDSRSLPGVVSDPIMSPTENETKIVSFGNDGALARLFENFPCWDFDVFKVHNICGELSLPYIALQVFHDFCDLGISQESYLGYMTALADHYRPQDEVLYHNSLHACDVLATQYFILRSMLFDEYDKMDLFASLLAAAAHDVDHDGYTNLFHIKTSSNLALTYNDGSVLENHHASVGWRLIWKSGVLKGLNGTTRAHIRSIFIKCILMTDMASHSQHFQELTDMAKYKDSQDAPSQLHALMTPSHVLGICLHSADISNVAKAYRLTVQWVERLMEEFFRQGDEEKKRKIPLSPLCDRYKTSISSSEVAFIKFVVLPWFDKLRNLVPDVTSEALKNLHINFEKYQHQVTCFNMDSRPAKPAKVGEKQVKLRGRRSMFLPQVLDKRVGLIAGGDKKSPKGLLNFSAMSESTLSVISEDDSRSSPRMVRAVTVANSGGSSRGDGGILDAKTLVSFKTDTHE